MREKYLTLLVVPHDERNVRRLRLSYRSLKGLGAVALVLFAVALAAVLTYGRVATRATRAAMLQRENETLAAENAKVDQIAQNLERTEQAYRQIRAMAGLPPREEDDTPPARRRAEAGAERPRETVPISQGPEATSGGEGRTLAGWPLTIKGFVTADYGEGEDHPGIDIAVPPNTPVVATAPGVVRESGSDRVYGNFVVLDHGEGLETMYAHNALLLVGEGEEVERGQTIAYSGNSGESTAPHLHYEVREDGTPVDPRRHMP
ncbi:MAG: peptidoglycan DD-metalloendopeptidase family protein [Gemmatimonadota bacterium]|nr:peptidoglycan DD-metalloendopeptidase family protein [Gemmatimonadota bacterium]